MQFRIRDHLLKGKVDMTNQMGFRKKMIEVEHKYYQCRLNLSHIINQIYLIYDIKYDIINKIKPADIYI